jgi:hypothetical protein
MLKIQELSATEGAIEATLKTSPGMGLFMAQAMAAVLADAPNYVEMQFKPGLCQWNAKWHLITVTVQRQEGLTPHEARKKAEQELQRIKDGIRACDMSTVVFEDGIDMNDCGWITIEMMNKMCREKYGSIPSEV